MKLGKTETDVLRRALENGSVYVTGTRERNAAVKLVQKGLLARASKWGNSFLGIRYIATDAASAALFEA